MKNADWKKVRGLFPYNLLVFRPRREFTVGEIVAIAEKAGLRVEVRIERNADGVAREVGR